MNGRRFDIRQAPPVRRVGTPPELTGAHLRPPLEWYAERDLPSPPPSLAAYRSEVLFVPVPDTLNEPAPFTMPKRVETVRAIRFYFDNEGQPFAGLRNLPTPFNAALFRLPTAAQARGFVFTLADAEAVPYVVNVPVLRAAASRDQMPIGSFLVQPMPSQLSACTVTLTDPALANLGISWVFACELFYTR